MSADRLSRGEGGSGLKGRGLEWNQRQRGGRGAIFPERCSRDGRTSAWAPQPAGCVAVLRPGNVQAEAGALMAAPCGAGEWCASSEDGRARRADTSGLPGGVEGSGRQHRLPVQGQLGTGWEPHPPARAVREASVPGERDSTAHRRGPEGSLGATPAAESAGYTPGPGGPGFATDGAGSPDHENGPDPRR